MKTRRAVSEIIASMIVLVIVSVLGVMLYNIAIGGMFSQQNNLLSDIGLKEEMVQERFEIVGVSRHNETTINVYIYNYGSVDVKITNIYLESPNLLRQLPSFNLQLSPGDMTYLTVDCSRGSGVTTYIIVSQVGVSNEYVLSQAI